MRAVVPAEEVLDTASGDDAGTLGLEQGCGRALEDGDVVA